MPDGIERLATILVAILVDIGFAALVGAGATCLLVKAPGSRWADSAIAGTRRWLRCGVLAIAIGYVAWIALVVLSTAQDRAGELVDVAGSVLFGSRLGAAWLAGAAALAVAALIAAAIPRGPTEASAVALLGSAAAFAACRAATSHAAATGDATPLVVQWLHVASTSLWAGLVWWSAWRVLPGEGSSPADSDAVRRWASKLSITATAALALVVATGGVNAWLRVASFDRLTSSGYGRVLFIKLALVAVAALLGASNRLLVLPVLARGRGPMSAGGVRSGRRFRRILRLESLLLVGAVIAGGVIAASDPP